jgi:hypothetical protein
MMAGAFGAALLSRCVVELNKRGAGHIHGQLHGGITSSLFGDVADDPALRSLLLEGLDSQLRGELPIGYHLMDVARSILRIGARRDACAEIPAPHEELLSSNPAIGPRNFGETWTDERRRRLEDWWAKFSDHAMLVVANRNVHRHQGSCLMGKQGKTGCRFNASWGHDIDESQCVELFCDASDIPLFEQIEIRCRQCYAGGALNSTTMKPEDKKILLTEEDNRRSLFFTAAAPTLKPEVGDDTRILHVDLKRPLLPTLPIVKEALDNYKNDHTTENIAKLRQALLLIIKDHLDSLLSTPSLHPLRDRLMRLTEMTTTEPGGRVPVIAFPKAQILVYFIHHQILSPIAQAPCYVY